MGHLAATVPRDRQLKQASGWRPANNAALDTPKQQPK